MDELAVILLGTNLGNRPYQLKQALKLIQNEIGPIDRASSIYETAAWGLLEQPEFLNMVIGVSTSKSPLEVLRCLLKSEEKMGRQRNQKWGPRIIDLDLLYHGKAILNLRELILPHPGIPERRFTLVPLNEIYPNIIHPVSGLNQQQLLDNCNDKSVVKPYRESL
jgi:2-amino-4-hydroxy-6-hydroxymethyldihydropteridine diphosphokinase